MLATTAQLQSVPLVHVKDMKLKHWAALGLPKADRDMITRIFASDDLQRFINETQGFTVSQFKANLKADTVQVLLKMGITPPRGVKPTVVNYQAYLEELLHDQPWLRHADPAKCLLKILWYLKTEMEKRPISVEESSGDEDV